MAGVAGLLLGCEWACLNQQLLRRCRGYCRHDFSPSSLDAKSCLISHWFSAWYFFPSGMRSLPRWWDISIPGNLSATREWTSSFSKQKLSGFSHLPWDIPAMCNTNSLHLQLPGACIAWTVLESKETTRLQESSLLSNGPCACASCQKCPLLLSGTKPNPTRFSGTSQQLFPSPAPAVGNAGNAELWVWGGASRNNVHTAYRTVHDFHVLWAKLFIPCSSLLHHQGKKKAKTKTQLVAPSPPFPPGQERGGEYLCATPDSLQRRSFFCGWVLGPNTSSGRIQKLLQTVIF